MKDTGRVPTGDGLWTATIPAIQSAELLAAKLPLGDWRASAIRAWSRLQNPHKRGVCGLGALSISQHHRPRQQTPARDILETSFEYRTPPRRGHVCASVPQRYPGCLLHI